MPTITPPANPSLGYIATLQYFLDLARHTAETASAEGNHRLVLQAIREGARIVTLLLKLAATQDQQQEQFSQALIESPGLEPLPEATTAVSGDQPPGMSPGGSLAKPKPANQKTNHNRQPSKTGRVNLELQPSDLTRELLAGMFHQGAGSEANIPEFPKWEKSGKLPGNNPLTEEDLELIQLLELYEKNLGKTAAAACQAPGPQV